MEIAAAIPTLPQPRRRRDISLKPGVYEGRILRARSRETDILQLSTAVVRDGPCQRRGEHQDRANFAFSMRWAEIANFGIMLGSMLFQGG
jgi:hypothetical protein